MSAGYNAVDLSQLPFPGVVETLSFEQILTETLAALVALDHDTFSALVESDPVVKILEVCAYRELLIRQRVNESSKAVMLAYAEDTDLDNIGANFSVQRLTITPEDDTTIPPTSAVMESDDDFRARIQMAPLGYSCAGPEGAYKFFSLSASGDVLDVDVSTPVAGTVLITVLSRTGDGTAPQSTLDAVTAATSPKTVRPLCDTVVVKSSQIIDYSVNAVLTILGGYDQDTVLANAQAALQAYTVATKKNGRRVTVSGVCGALSVAGVEEVDLLAPGMVANILPTNTQAANCTGITLTAVMDE